MNYLRLLLYVILYSIGLTLIIEGIFLNIISLITNDASYLIQGAIFIFLGSVGLSAGRYISAMHSDNKKIMN